MKGAIAAIAEWRQRNRSAKTWELASLSPKDTAPLNNFSGIGAPSRYSQLLAVAALGSNEHITRP